MIDAAGFYELAMLASLAGRVERQLLRALRLEFAPHLKAADEADLWFSPIIESASETGLVFAPTTLPELQRRLVEDPYRRLEPAWDLIFRMRTGVPFAKRAELKHSTWLLVQEELTYWGVRGGAARDEDARRIATLCAWVVNSRADERVAQDARSWLQMARLRLPAACWGLPGAEEMKAVAESLSRPRKLFVRRVVEGVELSERPLEAAHFIPTSAPAGPMRVDVIPRGEGSEPPQAALVGREGALVATTAPSVDLILSDGQAYALDLSLGQPQASGPAELPRRTVLVVLPHGGSLNGVLLTSDFVLTCGHGAKDWRPEGQVEILRSGSSPDGRTASPRPGRARPVVWSPLTGLEPLPGPFGPQADDLALLRLETRLDDAGLLDPPVVNPNRPVMGLNLTACFLSPKFEPTSTPRTLNGKVVNLSERGLVVEFLDTAGLTPGVSGTPVWLADGRLLGLISGAFSDRLTLVAPARPLASLLRATRRRVLVVGSGTKDELPENVWRPAEALGWALAKAGHALVCGGWPGVDHIVSRAFAAAVGDDALASRFVQLVESGSSPDFVSNVAPTFIDPDAWASQMSASADAVVALGGVGGTLKIGLTARAGGRVVLPVPGTDGDARRLYAEFAGEPGPRPFPDRRALNILEGDTASPEAAEAIADRILELLELCYDETKLAIYRRSAAAVMRLLDPGPDGDRELIGLRSELEEAAGAFLLSDADSDPRSVLSALLPDGALWLIRDLLQLEAAAAPASADEARLALLDAILRDAGPTDKLFRMLAAQPKTTDGGLRTPSAWKRLAGANEALRQRLDDLNARIADLERRQLALFELRSLAAKFLAPVDMATFDASYRELERATHRRAAYFDEELAARLMTSAEAADRVIGYILFWQAPAAALLPTLAASLRLERREAFEKRETRPLWLALECIGGALDDEALAHQLPLEIDALASALLTQLRASSDVDPGRECTRLLDQIVLRLGRSRTTERFASYSRFKGMRDGRRRYAWCVFVNAPPSRLDRIREVEYSLDPTFRRPVRVISEALHGFALLSEGWGEFTLKIRVSYKSGAVSTQSHRLELNVDAWPPGRVYSGPRDELATRLYAALSDPRWQWRTAAALARDAGIDLSMAPAILYDLARGGFVRSASSQSARGEELWGATAKIGALPMPVG